MTPTNTIREGISYLTNYKGEQTAVVFDLKNKQVHELIDDLFDTLDAIERQNEPTTSVDQVMKELFGDETPL